jgi:hypothetical protein
LYLLSIALIARSFRKHIEKSVNRYELSLTCDDSLEKIFVNLSLKLDDGEMTSSSSFVPDCQKARRYYTMYMHAYIISEPG